MLILSRKAGEAILLDGGIRIEVLAMDGGCVRLGIDAPREIGIVREEIAEGIADQNKRAGAGDPHQRWLEAFRPHGGDGDPAG